MSLASRNIKTIVNKTYLYTFNMSKKINEIWGKKYVPKEVATLVFV